MGKSKKRRKSGGSTKKLSLELIQLYEGLVKNYSVDELAQLAGLKVRQLELEFRRLTGHPPIVWLQALRLRNARTSLATARQVKEVHSSIKFRDDSSFHRAYKRDAGETPGDFFLGRPPGKTG